MRQIEHKLAVARGEKPAQKLFKDARVVNVFSGEIHNANVAVDDGRVIGFGDYEGMKLSMRLRLKLETGPKNRQT